MDLIERQGAIDALLALQKDDEEMYGCSIPECFDGERAAETINALPSVQPTLYGYKIEHLAYIARVMEKEGLTAEYAVRTFDDLGRAVKMIIDEVQEAVEKRIFDGFN